MKRTISTFVLAGALVLGSLPAQAAEPVPQQQPTVEVQKQRLENGYRELARSNTGTKLGAVQQAEIMKQQRAIKDMIRRLEAGENVAPSEVDRVLQAQ